MSNIYTRMKLKDLDGYDEATDELIFVVGKVTHDPATRKIQTNNKSGVTGVSKVGDFWQANISKNAYRFYLGSYNTMHDAIAARKAAELLSYEELKTKHAEGRL